MKNHSHRNYSLRSIPAKCIWQEEQEQDHDHDDDNDGDKIVENNTKNRRKECCD